MKFCLFKWPLKTTGHSLQLCPCRGTLKSFFTKKIYGLLTFRSLTKQMKCTQVLVLYKTNVAYWLLIANKLSLFCNILGTLGSLILTRGPVSSHMYSPAASLIFVAGMSICLSTQSDLCTFLH